MRTHQRNPQCPAGFALWENISGLALTAGLLMLLAVVDRHFHPHLSSESSALRSAATEGLPQIIDAKVSRESRRLLLLRANGRVESRGLGADAVDFYWDANDEAAAIAMAPSGAFDLVALRGGPVMRLADGQMTAVPHLAAGGETESIDVSPDGRWAAVADRRTGLQVVPLAATDSGQGAMRLPDRVRCLSFSAARPALLAATMDGELILLDLARGRVRRRWAAHGDVCCDVALGPDGRVAASCGCDNTVKVWSVATGRLLWEDHDFMSFPLAVAISPDGRTLAVGGLDSAIRILELDTGRRLAEFAGHTGGVGTLQFLTNERLFSASYDGTFRTWELQ